MNSYLVEVQEIITHILTVEAEDEQGAHSMAMGFVCIEAEQLAPVYVCRAVKRLEGD